MDEGLIEVYKRIRPGDLATPDNAKQLIYATFSTLTVMILALLEDTNSTNALDLTCL